MTYCPLCHKSLCAREKRVVSKSRFNYKGRRRGSYGVGAGGANLRASPRKAISSKADKEAKSLTVVSSACGHLFHQACVNDYIHQNRTTGEGFGGTYVVNCPLCQMSISSSKMLRVDIDAHVGNLDGFFHDLYKLKYMNDELKQTLQREWADIADVDGKLEAQNEIYKKLCKEKYRKLNDIKTQDDKIAKVIEDASTCYRYREIEKQLLDENANLQAVVRRMETMLENRSGDNPSMVDSSIASTDTSKDAFHDVEANDSSGESRLQLKSDEINIIPSVNHDMSCSVDTGVNYKISVEKKWSLVIEKSDSNEDYACLSNEYPEAINDNGDGNLMLVEAEHNFNGHSTLTTENTCAARVGISDSTILASSVEALRHPLPEELKPHQPNDEQQLKSGLNHAKSEHLRDEMNQFLLESKAGKMKLTECESDVFYENKTRPCTVTKLPGNRILLQFCKLGKTETETIDKNSRIQEHHTREESDNNAEFKLTRSISYVIKRWDPEETRVFEIEDNGDRDRINNSENSQAGKRSLGIFVNLNRNAGINVNQDRRKRKGDGRMGGEKLIDVMRKKSLMMLNSDYQNSNAVTLYNDIKAGTEKAKLTIDLRTLHYSLHSLGPRLSKRFLASSLMSSPMGSWNTKRAQASSIKPRMLGSFSAFSVLEYRDGEQENCVGQVQNSKSWTRILNVAEAQRSAIVSLSNGNLGWKSSQEKETETTSNYSTSSLMSITDLIIKPPPEDDGSTKNCDWIRVVPPPPPTFEPGDLHDNIAANERFSQFIKATAPAEAMTWINESLAEGAKELYRLEVNDSCGGVSSGMQMNNGAGDNGYLVAAPFNDAPIHTLNSRIYCLNETSCVGDQIGELHSSEIVSDCIAAERFTSELSLVAMTNSYYCDGDCFTYSLDGTTNTPCMASNMMWDVNHNHCRSDCHPHYKYSEEVTSDAVAVVEAVDITGCTDYNNIIWNGWNEVSTPIVWEEPGSSGSSGNDCGNGCYQTY